MQLPDLIPVKLAGGVGSRLWPVSRADRPKQFQFLLGDLSLFQRTAQRCADPQRYKPPIVVTGAEYQDIALEQLGEIGIEPAHIIAEPEGRNTAPAIALAALAAEEINPDASFLILPSDHLIRDDVVLQGAIDTAHKLAANEALFVTFGIQPNAAETGYGYIRRSGQDLASGKAFAIQEFTEKPSAPEAQRMLQSGEYFWNSGMFLFPLAAFLREMKRLKPSIVEGCKKALEGVQSSDRFIAPHADLFRGVESISVDYALMEKTGSAAVVPIDPGWSDVGSWAALWEVAEHDSSGNALIGNAYAMDTRNAYIRAEESLTTVLGLEDIIVVNTKDAILVASKARAQDVKALVGGLEQQGYAEAKTHKRVRRPWGSFCTLDQGPGFQVKRITVKPGQQLSLQYHHRRSEHWTVVSGQARVTVGADVRLLGPNESVLIPIESVHRLENPGSELVELIEVQFGDYLGEDDIVRLEDSYGRARQRDSK